MNYYLTRLTQISTLDGQQVEATFDDGFTAIIDLLPWIVRGGIRADLADPRIFRGVLVNDEGAPEWPGEIDLSPGTLRAWCEAGRVLSPEETNAWITQAQKKAQSVA